MASDYAADDAEKRASWGEYSTSEAQRIEELLQTGLAKVCAHHA